MVRRSSLIVLTALAFGALSASPDAQGPGPTSPSITSISGRVIDGLTQTPISGAVVTIGGSFVYGTFDEIISIDALDRALMDSKRRTQVRTDRSGRFAFTDLPPGAYGVTARMDGWSTGAYGAARPGDPGQWLDVSAGQRATVTVAVWKHPSIGGTVINERGEPVDHAVVQLLQWQLSAGRRTLKATRHFETDDRGEYGGTVPPGEYVVRAQSTNTQVRAWTGPDVQMSGFPPVFYPAALSPEAAEPVTLAPGARNANVTLRLPLQPMRRFVGQLTNPTGTGQLPTQVILIASDGLDTRRGAAVDKQGRFVFERLFPGRYLLEASSSRSLTPGAVPMLWARAIVEVQDTDGVVTLALRRGLIVRGRMEFDGPDPPSVELLREFSVFMLPPPAEIGDVIPPRVQVQPDGTFVFELPGGEYLTRLFTGFNVDRFFDAGARRPSDSELRSLSEWQVRSARANGRDIIDLPLVLAADVTELVVTLARGAAAVQGRVRGRLNRPQDYRAVLIPADSSLWAYSGSGRRFAAAPVSADGRFTVLAPPGDYLLGAVKGLPLEWRNGDLIAQLATGMTGVHLAAGESVAQSDPPAIEMPTGPFRASSLPSVIDTGLDVVRPAAVATLSRPAFDGATVTGRVVSDDGQPLADVRVSQWVPARDDVFTDSAGRFILQRVQPGRRTLYASKRGWSASSSGGEAMTLMVTGDRVDDVVIRLTGAAEITGAVRDQDGLPVEGAHVRAWGYQPGRDAVERTHRSYTGAATADEQGRYRLAGLPPGRYLVSTMASVHRDVTDIPATTQADIDRASGRSVPQSQRSGVSRPYGFPAVFNGGVAESAQAEPIDLTPGSTRTVDLDVRAVPLAQVAVTLRSPDGEPPASPSSRLEVADRIIRSFGGLWEYPARQTSGELVFENLLPGRYAFGVRTSPRDGQYFSAFADIVVTEGEQQRVAIDLLPGSTIAGRLVIDGAPPAPDAGLVIRAYDVSNRMDFTGLGVRVRVAENGTFSISNVMPGRYRFELTLSGKVFQNAPVSQTVDGRETLHLGVEVQPGLQVSNLQLAVVSKGSDVTGVARDTAGRPARSATVVMFPADRAHWQPRSPHVLSVRTDHDGRYALSNVPSGDYRIAAADLEPDVWLDAEALSKLVERSVAARIESPRSLTIDLTAP